MAKGVIVGLVAINVQQPLTIAAAAAGVAPTMCTHPRCQRLVATIVEEELELVATIVDKRTSGAAPWMPIKEARS
jgi:hypothetical protein